MRVIRGLGICVAAMALASCSYGGSGGGGGGGGDGGGGGGDGGSDGSLGTLPNAKLRTGEAGPILLQANLLTPDQHISGGAILFAQDRILCAGEGCEAGRFGDVAAGATVLATGGTAYPGLIDLHNHVSWNTWKRVPFEESCYDNRDEWRNDSRVYDHDVKGPHNLVSRAAYCEMTKYGEIRAMMGGATVTQGASRDQECVHTLVRNIDDWNDLDGDHFESRISRVNRMRQEDADSLIRRMDRGRTRTWLVHAGEGVDAYAKAEFAPLEEMGLLRPELAVIHGTGFGPEEFAKMGAAGANLIFSPLSNTMLYGRPTDAVAARDAGVNISLAPDWSLSGGESLLEELRFYDAWNRDHQDGAISDEELVEMVTINPARTAKMDQQLGRLRRNFRADILVLRSDVEDPYRALIAARPEQVALVVIGGRVRYGDADLVDAVDPSCEAIDVCGTEKRLCVKDPDGDPELYLDQTYASIVARLDELHPDLAPPVRCEVDEPIVPFCQR